MDDENRWDEKNDHIHEERVTPENLSNGSSQHVQRNLTNMKISLAAERVRGERERGRERIEGEHRPFGPPASG